MYDLIVSPLAVKFPVARRAYIYLVFLFLSEFKTATVARGRGSGWRAV